MMCSIGFALGIVQQDVMRPNGPEDKEVLLKMEGESVFHGDRSLPSIVGSLDFFHSKGRMMDIREKQGQLFLERKANFNREGPVLLFEAVTETITLPHS
jgi:hypothetical protein